MPRFLRSIADSIDQKETLPVNRVEGFKENGAVILRDRRGTAKTETPSAAEKGIPLSDDPLAIYKPTGAKSVDAAKAMGQLHRWPLRGRQRHRARSRAHPVPTLQVTQKAA